MKFKVVLYEHDDGVAVFCPGLQGCAETPDAASVRALEKAGFRITRQSKHIIMTDGTRIVVVSRQDPVDP